jgi:CRISP-associated protein Cas1
MPLAYRRNPTVTLVCQRPGCGTVFHPFRGRESGENIQKYCGLACSRDAGSFAHTGRWPERNPATGNVLPPPVPAPARQSPQYTQPPQRTQPAQPPQPAALQGEDAAFLNFPPLGEAARMAWQDTGLRRAAQVAKRLQIEAGHSGGRTILLAGQGSYLGVENGALVVHMGRTCGGPAPAREMLYPALHGVSRIFWVGRDMQPAGTLTLAALTFCRRENIQLAILDGAGDSLLNVAPDAPTDVALRRRQYTLEPDAQVRIARIILTRKLEGQRRTILAHPELPAPTRALDALDMALSWLKLDQPTPYLSTPEGLLMYEARCARAYWSAWAGLPLRWERLALKRIPPHWRAARERSSPLAPNSNARHAVDPVNALVNYAYGVLESQTRQALTTTGFDLACGLLHTDKLGRDSLVYDLMECERGAVDRLVLTLLAKTTFRLADFTRSPDGSCRLHPELARLVVASCRVPQDHLDAHARWLRSALLHPPKQTRRVAPEVASVQEV